MWIPKGAALIRVLRLSETLRLLDEIWYIYFWKSKRLSDENITALNTSDSIYD